MILEAAGTANKSVARPYRAALPEVQFLCSSVCNGMSD
jgi:hypothetical protein